MTECGEVPDRQLMLDGGFGGMVQVQSRECDGSGQKTHVKVSLRVRPSWL